MRAKKRANPELLSALQDFVDQHDKVINSVHDINCQISNNSEFVDQIESELEKITETVSELKSKMKVSQ